MGAFSSKQWDEMLEVNKMEEESKAEMAKEKKSLRDRVRTKILRSDPRSATDDVDRTPIAVEKSAGTPDTPVLHKLKTLDADPRSPGGVERTPIVVEERRVGRRAVLPSDDVRTPVRGNPPPALSLLSTDLLDSPAAAGGDDPRSPSHLAEHPRTPITTDTPATIDLDKVPVMDKLQMKGQPRQVLQDKFREAVTALQDQLEDEAAPAAAGELCATPPTATPPNALPSILVDSPGTMII